MTETDQAEEMEDGAENRAAADTEAAAQNEAATEETASVQEASSPGTDEAADATEAAVGETLDETGDDSEAGAEQVDEAEESGLGDAIGGSDVSDLDAVTGAVYETDAPSDSNFELSAEDAGVAEALEAWSEGGHADDEFDDLEEIAPVQFAQLDSHPVKSVSKQDRLNNVWLDITVELGRKDMTVRELLNLKEQDYIELNKLAGEAFDILINKRLFAEGEIVVVTDLMAVRITRLKEYTTSVARD